MSYNPYKTPTTTGEALVQMHLGQMGYGTGTSANSTGFEIRRIEEQKRKAKEKAERERKAAENSWWK